MSDEKEYIDSQGNVYYELDNISDIIQHPDYVGINPNEKDSSYELVKCMDKNIMIGIKLEKNGDYFYVATMHQISNKALQTYVRNKRLKNYVDINETV